MMASSGLLLATGVFVTLATVAFSTEHMEGETLLYNITTTWDNETVDANKVVTLDLSSVKEGLAIDIHSPLYGDELPSAKPGRFAKLYDFDTVIILFMSSASLNYLELQFGPGGHYLAYDLKGVRNVRDDSVIISNYTASINEGNKTWTGRAIIPADAFPAGVDSFNAYEIHGMNATRKYMALFPVAFNTSSAPDVHNIETFQPIDLRSMIPVRNVLVEVHDFSGTNAFLICNNFMAIAMFALLSHFI